VYLIFALVIFCFLTYDKLPKKFGINKVKFITFIITIASLILWYIDTESGRFKSGMATVIVLGFICYWVLLMICDILNFCMKVYSFYKDSKKANLHSPYVVSKEMTIKEAREILNVGKHASPEDIMNSYLKLIVNNDPVDGGSPYISAKIETAKKVLMESS
jgi:hypothetical protein